jgi:bifunctional enzyme CysN/CysC
MRFPVQYVLRPNLNFRGFAGTLASGIVRKGEVVKALPSGKTSKIKSIVTYEGEVDEAFSPQAITITLEDEIDVSRGDMLVHPGNEPNISSQIDANVVWMNEKPLVPGRTYWLKHATRTVTAEVADFRYGIDVNTLEHRPATQLAMNEVGVVSLSLSQPLSSDPYKANAATGGFIIIDRMTNVTVGAGMIAEVSDRRGHGDLWGSTPIAGKLKQKTSKISLADREQRLAQKGATILIYGLTGSGKATIAYALEQKLWDTGRTVSVLYGPDMRQGLCRDLGFTADDRSENLRRSAEVAKILNDTGQLVICAFVAPHDAVRRRTREVIGADRFVEIFLNCPVDVCRQRDTTNAWKLADQGKLAQFPGVNAAFEDPTQADLAIQTDRVSVEQSVEQILAILRQKKLIS